jgi:hypothetical protein
VFRLRVFALSKKDHNTDRFLASFLIGAGVSVLCVLSAPLVLLWSALAGSGLRLCFFSHTRAFSRSGASACAGVRSGAFSLSACCSSALCGLALLGVLWYTIVALVAQVALLGRLLGAVPSPGVSRPRSLWGVLLWLSLLSRLLALSPSPPSCPAPWCAWCCAPRSGPPRAAWSSLPSAARSGLAALPGAGLRGWGCPWRCGGRAGCGWSRCPACAPASCPVRRCGCARWAGCGLLSRPWPGAVGLSLGWGGCAVASCAGSRGCSAFVAVACGRWPSCARCGSSPPACPVAPGCFSCALFPSCSRSAACRCRRLFPRLVRRVLGSAPACPAPAGASGCPSCPAGQLALF